MSARINLRVDDDDRLTVRTRFAPGQRIHGNVENDGFRRYTVVRVGHKLIHLLDTSELRAVRVDRAALESSRAVRVDYESNPSVVLRILQGRLEEAKRYGRQQMPGIDIAAVIDLLNQGASQ